MPGFRSLLFTTASKQEHAESAIARISPSLIAFEHHHNK